MRPLAALWLAVALAGCGARAEPSGFAHVQLRAEPLQLHPGRPAETRVGELTWAGGVRLTEASPGRLGGLSGLDVADDGRFISQTDGGDLFRGRLVLDPAGHLTGVEDVTVERLLSETGEPYRTKGAADSEDITFLPDGGYGVSFEQRHRVLLYGPGGGAPTPAPISPDMRWRGPNLGLEALAWREGRLYEGAEDGEIWRCDPARTGACISVMPSSPFRGFRLTGLDACGRGFVAVYRSLDVFYHWRAVVAWLEPARADGSGPWTARKLAELKAPFTRDNMEGIAAVARPGGGWRLYLVSDDNFARYQRTLLLAFDWAGPPTLAGEGRAEVGSRP